MRDSLSSVYEPGGAGIGRLREDDHADDGADGADGARGERGWVDCCCEQGIVNIQDCFSLTKQTCAYPCER